MIRGAPLKLCLSALLLAAPTLLCALEMPAAARLLSERQSPLADYALPTGPYDGTRVPSQRLEGQVDRRTWRIDGTASTLLQLMAPLRAQLEADGYAIVLDCAADDCGGFDFRFGTEVAPAPQMHVSIGNYRFLSALKGEAEAVSLLVSRLGSSAYLQEIRVTPADAAQMPAAALPPETLDPGTTATETADNSLDDLLLSRGHAVLGDLDFETGAGRLGAGPYPSLVQIADFLARHPDYRIVLVGHTDSVGGLEGNLSLSRQRAEAVRARLIEAHGVDAARVSADGVGFLAPLAPNLTPEGREANRRVEAVLLPAG